MNNDKTEIIVCGTNPKRKLVNIDSIDIGDVNVALSSEVKDLGVIIDSRISFNKHISFLRRSCYYQIRRISNIRPFISVQSAKSLAVSLILSKLDYCNSLFYDMSDENFHDLQLLQNHAARVVLKAKRDCSATALLKELHWLPVRQRVLYKIALIVFKCLHFSDFPSYLKDLVVLHKPSKFLRSGDKHLLQEPFKKLLAISVFITLVHMCGMLCPSKFVAPLVLLHLNVYSKHIILELPFINMFLTFSFPECLIHI